MVAVSGGGPAVVVVVATVVVALGLVLAVQVLARVLAGQSFEVPWRPLATSRRVVRSPSPPELAQLEAIVTDFLAGDRAAQARLVPRLRAVGVSVPPGASASELAAVLDRLPALGRGADGPGADGPGADGPGADGPGDRDEDRDGR